MFMLGLTACQQGGTAEDCLAFLPSNQSSAKLLPREIILEEERQPVTDLS